MNGSVSMNYRAQWLRKGLLERNGGRESAMGHALSLLTDEDLVEKYQRHNLRHIKALTEGAK